MALEKFDKMKQEQGAYLANLRAQIAEMDYLTMVDEAKEKAEAKASRKIAAKMLRKGCDSSLISEVTGLSKAKISRLKNGK